MTIKLAEDVDTVFLDSEVYAMHSSVIEVLLEFPNLRHVELSSPVGFILDDEFVDTMARAWSTLFPSLSEISTRTYSPYRPQWQKVRELVPAYARTCADERRFVLASSDQ
ncbi:hypothetical protein K438DRAFT_1997331 [Mycena galopus ATCC 62051]|nr:hypothetical protein K438DRAFT_1997331 [Mycena galopus ATCC 62051]